ncbi:hypothetical protein B0O99DRAFT_329116 [Bisporella sp. PMI_857]|nr:hypothetical protein B0O99DRAFT_363789 [Bisporella sp. PMI_857]KAH8600567.1 hypothetical protein B0O99DRAFT_329116 [Bisporella sp. PMI_857]
MRYGLWWSGLRAYHGECILRNFVCVASEDVLLCIIMILAFFHGKLLKNLMLFLAASFKNTTFIYKVALSHPLDALYHSHGRPFTSLSRISPKRLTPDQSIEPIHGCNCPLYPRHAITSTQKSRINCGANLSRSSTSKNCPPSSIPPARSTFENAALANASLTKVSRYLPTATLASLPILVPFSLKHSCITT